MPNEAMFLTVAAAFDGAALDAEGLVAPAAVLVTPAVLDGGLLTAQLADTLDGCRSEAFHAAEACRAAALECRQRAAECALHWARLDAWRQADAEYRIAARDWRPGSGPLPMPPGAAPTKAHAWIE